MSRILSRAAVALCLAGIALSAPAFAQQQEGQAPAAEQSVLKATHGSWEVHCVGGGDNCVMQQFGETAEGERALLVAVKRLAGVTNEGQPVPAALEVLAPLGIMIPYNVRVKVDENNVQPVPLVRCVADRCIAQAPLSAQDVERFKGGRTARFGFFLNSEVLVDISLNGFTAAYNSLTPVPVQGTGHN